MTPASGARMGETMPPAEQPVNAETFTFALRKEKLRQALRSEGHYLLRSNLSGEDPSRRWQRYIQLETSNTESITSANVRAQSSKSG